MVHTQKTGFNRYIVECKYRIRNMSDEELTGFNRYIVECKLKTSLLI